MREIKVKIDCTEKYCGKCAYLSTWMGAPNCILFSSGVFLDRDVKKPLGGFRCPACLAAEIKGEVKKC